MRYSDQTQLKSMSAYLIASLQPSRDTTTRSNTAVSREQYLAASLVICDYEGARYTVQELMDRLTAQHLDDSEQSPDKLEHDITQLVVSIAHSFGPVSREALLDVLWYEEWGFNDSDELETYESPRSLLTRWNALSPQEQALEWEECVALCERGIGDMHQFYSIIMPQLLVGYVGD